jgi:hypothetical protein
LKSFYLFLFVGKGWAMSIKLTNSLAILGLVSVITFFSPAQDTSAADKKSPEQPIISEIRFGADTHGIGGREEGMISLSGAALFQKVSLGASLDSFLSPRPHVGISASTKTSAAYAGFTWTYNVSDPIFIELEFGGAVNNSPGAGSDIEGRIGMGCTLSFREGMNIGYRITPSVSIMLTGEHMSNADICDNKSGLTNAGVRIGYSF